MAFLFYWEWVCQDWRANKKEVFFFWLKDDLIFLVEFWPIHQLIHCFKPQWLILDIIYLTEVIASTVHWRCKIGDRSVRAISVISGNPFPIKKRMNTELFIDRKQGLYTQNDIKKTFKPHWRGQTEIGRKVNLGMRTLTADCLESLTLLW